MDPLVEIPIEQWPLLQEKFKKRWPLNIGGFYTLYQNIKYPNIREAFKFKVYCPNGDIENGFVAVSDKFSGLKLIMFSITDDTRRLEEAILNTKRIDWTKNIFLDLIPSVIVPFVENKVLPSLNLRNCNILKGKILFLDKNSKLKEIRYPPNTYLATVNQDDIRRIDNIWPFMFTGSYFSFCTLAANDLAFGLYSADKELLAWVFINEHNYLRHLYCEEKHRRKGYAKFLVKCAINYQLGLGNDVYTFVVENNESSFRLFYELGFVNVDDGALIKLIHK